MVSVWFGRERRVEMDTVDAIKEKCSVVSCAHAGEYALKVHAPRPEFDRYIAFYCEAHYLIVDSELAKLLSSVEA